MEIVYRRPPDRTERFDQELLHDGGSLKITLLRRPLGAEPWRITESVEVRGGTLLWFTFPGRWYEVAAVHDAAGGFLGHYTNVIRPPEMEGSRWRITDLFLDLWQPADTAPGGPDDPRVLDRDELAAAVERGALDEATAERATTVLAEIEGRARAGAWPPAEVLRWSLEAVPSLRFRRDEPGSYRANLIAGRIIGFGIYVLGAVALTSLVFVIVSDALTRPGTARTVWLGALGLEVAALLGLALAGRLPATRRVRPERALSEETLFLGAAAASVAVLLVNDSSLWRTLLASVYGSLGVFLAIFAACRALIDRRLPLAALAGLLLSVLALVVLL